MKDLHIWNNGSLHIPSYIIDNALTKIMKRRYLEADNYPHTNFTSLIFSLLSLCTQHSHFHNKTHCLQRTFSLVLAIVAHRKHVNIFL